MKDINNGLVALTSTELRDVHGGGWLNVLVKIADGVLRIGSPVVGGLIVGLKDGIVKGLTDK